MRIYAAAGTHEEGHSGTVVMAPFASTTLGYQARQALWRAGCLCARSPTDSAFASRHHATCTAAAYEDPGLHLPTWPTANGNGGPAVPFACPRPGYQFVHFRVRRQLSRKRSRASAMPRWKILTGALIIGSCQPGKKIQIKMKHNCAVECVLCGQTSLSV